MIPASLCTCQPLEIDRIGPPLFRLICHCKTCQAFSGQPANDECTFFRQDCPGLDLNLLSFKRRGMSPIERGTCKRCGKASISQARLGFLGHLIMIPSVLLNPIDLPEPVAHVYYHRRVADVHDRAPKVSGGLRSQLAIQTAVMRALIRRGPGQNVSIGSRPQT